MGGTAMTWGTEQDPWPDELAESDDEYPDFLWPDDDGAHDEDEHDEDEHDEDEDEQDDGRPEAAGRPATAAAGAGVGWGGPVPAQWAAQPAAAYVHDASERWRRILALSVTAVVAVGLGAGAVLVYRNAEAGAKPPAAASQGTGRAPGQGGQQAPGQGGGPAGRGGQGTVTEMQIVATVTAVGQRTITIGGGPVQAVKAAVTSSTRFTGSVRTLSGVRRGDVVAVEVLIENGAAKVVTLQDPASES
jgi:hypothetical protein